MRTGRGAIGVVGIDSDRVDLLPTVAERRLLEALIDQSALAIERVHLVEDMERVRRTFETERLRAALLTSISHDLKTPLAAVLGAAGTLRDLASRLDQDQKDELLATIIDESERLNRFIANLLDMTRLESGAIVPNTARHDLHEIVGSVLRRAGKILAPYRIELDLAGDLPMLELDAVLFEQVLFNILDNASKHAPAGTMIVIRSRREPDDIISLQIMDEGDGIPASELEHIFEKFYRARKGDRVRAGTGLGLAISRGFVEAMHGTISAANRSDRTGAVFTIRLPMPAVPVRMGEVA
jgi:two-component system, OmpR family, sensor histidine kinase KdpD